MTIFGFNTDVKHADTIYHVQSEARASDLLVETLVFVKGQCIGKRTVSYAENSSAPGFSDEAIHALLKAQHRTVIDSIMAGNMQSALGKGGEAREITGSGLSLQWIKAEPIGSQSSITMHFEVTEAGRGVSGAEVVSRIGSAPDSPIIARATTDNSGKVEMRIAISDDLRRESAITVQATHGYKSAIRKFRFKKPEQP